VKLDAKWSGIARFLWKGVIPQSAQKKCRAMPVFWLYSLSASPPDSSVKASSCMAAISGPFIRHKKQSQR